MVLLDNSRTDNPAAATISALKALPGITIDLIHEKAEGKKDSHALAKLVIDACAPVLTVIGILIGIYNFHQEQKENDKKNR